MQAIEDVIAGPRGIEAMTRRLNEVHDILALFAEHEFEKLNLADAATAYWRLKCAYDDLDAARKAFYAIVDAVSKHHLPKLMDAQGVDKIQVPDLARSFYPQVKMSCSFHDKMQGLEWLESMDAGDLAVPTVNASTLTSFVKDMIDEQGIEPPEDIVKVNTYTITGSSKYTPK